MPDFTPQIKTYFGMEPHLQPFSVDEKHLENREGKQSKFLFLFLCFVAQEGMDLRQ